MRHSGRITTWKDEQGFGFITSDSGGEQVFVHVKSFLNRQRRPVGSEVVTYQLNKDAKGRARAENVTLAGDRSPIAISSAIGPALLTLAALFLMFVAASVFAGKLPLAILGLYLGASAVAFLAYALDKSAARSDRWRTKESTLHLFALVGGWPGALAAQRLLRHKSRKLSFQVLFWATVLLNCGALGWLFSPAGSAALRHILGAA